MHYVTLTVRNKLTDTFNFIRWRIDQSATVKNGTIINKTVWLDTLGTEKKHVQIHNVYTEYLRNMKLTQTVQREINPNSTKITDARATGLFNEPAWNQPCVSGPNSHSPLFMFYNITYIKCSFMNCKGRAIKQFGDNNLIIRKRSESIFWIQHVTVPFNNASSVT